MYCFLFLKSFSELGTYIFSYMKTGHVEKKSSKMQQTPKFNSELSLPPTHRHFCHAPLHFPFPPRSSLLPHSFCFPTFPTPCSPFILLLNLGQCPTCAVMLHYIVVSGLLLFPELKGRVCTMPYP